MEWMIPILKVSIWLQGKFFPNIFSIFLLSLASVRSHRRSNINCLVCKARQFFLAFAKSLVNASLIFSIGLAKY
jgi:hypothetical protein